MSSESVALCAVRYHDALRAFEEGDLQFSREQIESLLHDLRATDSDGAHVLFLHCLLLLASIYSTVGATGEADRLLATSAGYATEHLGPDHLGLATIAYNRAVIRVEDYRRDAELPADDAPPPPSSSRSGSAGAPVLSLAAVIEARDVFLEEAAWRLRNELGVDRLLLADVYHTHGVCEYLLENYVSALESFRRSLEVRVHYTDHSGVTELKMALTLEHVSQLYRLLGTLPARTKALDLLGLVTRTRRRWLGPSHPLYGSALFAAGVMAAELQRWALAEEALAEAAAVARATYAEGDLRLEEVEHWLASVRDTATV